MALPNTNLQYGYIQNDRLGILEVRDYTEKDEILELAMDSYVAVQGVAEELADGRVKLTLGIPSISALAGVVKRVGFKPIDGTIIQAVHRTQRNHCKNQYESRVTIHHVRDAPGPR